MFLFGSQPSAENEEDDISDTLEWVSSKEISISKDKNSLFAQSGDTDVLLVKSVKLCYIKPSSLLRIIREENIALDENISQAEQHHSDLIPAKYEGGFKIWECTKDIANILEPEQLSDRSVLDLGCGVGLLGILALKLGAKEVHFQDYNADVLKYATIYNVKLNADNQLISKCRFFSGDWASFVELVQSKYDVILTSETIYNPKNYMKLHETLHRLLQPTGTILVGAKSYYFGVGGSTRQFEQLIKKENVFNSEVIWKCTEGVQREILRLSRNMTQTSDLKAD